MLPVREVIPEETGEEESSAAASEKGWIPDKHRTLQTVRAQTSSNLKKKEVTLTQVISSGSGG